MDREKTIVRTSLIGIGANVLLAAFKAAVGLAAHSIAVVLDAVNNLSDALSSIITIAGAKYAGRAPDKNHPMGHGRAEYLSALIVAAIILYAGITAFIESVKKIIHPEKAEYTAVSLIVIVAAIIVKILLGTYVKKQGEKVNSGSLTASGSDALFDAVLSTSVLASAVIFLVSGISLEAYVGVLISAFIIKAGIEMARETLDDILGHRVESSLSKEIKAVLTEDPEIRGAYDLFVNNYGPDRDYASVHVEVRDTMKVSELDVLTRHAVERVYEKTGVLLTGISVYSYNTENEEAIRMRELITEKAKAHEGVLQIHGFYVNKETKQIRFDAVVSFGTDVRRTLEAICAEVEELYPGYDVKISPDIDISD